jgi:hypothetical protein
MAANLVGQRKQAVPVFNIWMSAKRVEPEFVS